MSMRSKSTPMTALPGRMVQFAPSEPDRNGAVPVGYGPNGEPLRAVRRKIQEHGLLDLTRSQRRSPRWRMERDWSD